MVRAYEEMRRYSGEEREVKRQEKRRRADRLGRYSAHCRADRANEQVWSKKKKIAGEAARAQVKGHTSTN